MAKEQLGEGSVRTGLLEGNIVETVYRGYITVPMVTEVRKQLDQLLLQHPGADWLIDSLEATGIAPAPHAERMAVFELFQRRGGSRIATVVRSAVTRMMSATFAFAFGLPMKTFETRDEALAFLRTPPKKK